MKLDIQRFALKKGQLLNTEGRVCWLDGETFVCGALVYYGNTRCTKL